MVNASESRHTLSGILSDCLISSSDGVKVFRKKNDVFIVFIGKLNQFVMHLSLDLFAHYYENLHWYFDFKSK
jgi:hypothetical protein